MNTTWKWLEDGQTVEIKTADGPLLFKGTTVKESEWRGYYDRIADEGEILTILRTARASFLTGTAEYANARGNLRNLLSELAAANVAVFDVAKDIDVFFAPPEITKAFGRDRTGLIDFAMDFVARTYVRGTDGSGQ